MKNLAHCAWFSLLLAVSCGSQNDAGESAAMHSGGAAGERSDGAGGADSQGGAGMAGHGPEGGIPLEGGGGQDDAPVLRSCPAGGVSTGTRCEGNLSCTYQDRCICGVCCYANYVCTAGIIAIGGYNDGCTQVHSCDAGATADAPALDARASDAGPKNAEAGAPICTPGADPTCNDNPGFASLHGHCTAEGTCVCLGDAAPVAASGRCP